MMVQAFLKTWARSRKKKKELVKIFKRQWAISLKTNYKTKTASSLDIHFVLVKKKFTN